MTMRKWLLTLLNFQTIAILVIAMISCFVAIRYQIKIHQSMMLFGLIISFPLVFSLQSAYKGRERAREYLSSFNAGLISVREAFLQSGKISTPNQQRIQQLIGELHHDFFTYLQYGKGEPTKILESFSRVSNFMIEQKAEVNSKLKFRVGRYMRDVHDSATYLVSTKTHKTVNGIRALSTLSAFIFPVIQAAFLLNVFDQLPGFVIYVISFCTSLVLAILQLIQQQLEDPFDQDGLDDIQLEVFSFPTIAKT
jgi:hypothetical protein